jgi:hypothetical protein
MARSSWNKIIVAVVQALADPSGDGRERGWTPGLHIRTIEAID